MQGRRGLGEQPVAAAPRPSMIRAALQGEETEVMGLLEARGWEPLEA